ncbi:MAG: GIY-YIG nuclease family protein [Desulfamplus sp.]|nr:GIY-YIG nuclease family protein [Desulfamplus sp.]
MKGWVYIITNKAMPDILKVGFTMKDPEIRAGELNHTGTPHPYKVEYHILIENPQAIEQKVHRQLYGKREGKEWFKCPIGDAIASIKTVAGAGVLLETYSNEKNKEIKKEEPKVDWKATEERINRERRERLKLQNRIDEEKKRESAGKIQTEREKDFKLKQEEEFRILAAKHQKKAEERLKKSKNNTLLRAFVHIFVMCILILFPLFTHPNISPMFFAFIFITYVLFMIYDLEKRQF